MWYLHHMYHVEVFVYTLDSKIRSWPIRGRAQSILLPFPTILTFLSSRHPPYLLDHFFVHLVCWIFNYSGVENHGVVAARLGQLWNRHVLGGHHSPRTPAVLLRGVAWVPMRAAVCSLQFAVASRRVASRRVTLRYATLCYATWRYETQSTWKFGVNVSVSLVYRCYAPPLDEHEYLEHSPPTWAKKCVRSSLRM